MFYDLHVKGKFERSLNATFINVVLKKPGVADAKDFRPIRLLRR